MTKVRLLVHLGPMKTGTSSFAAHLDRHAKDGTLPPNVVYPTGSLWFEASGAIVKHHDLVEIATASSKEFGEKPRKTDVTPEMVHERLSRIAAHAKEQKGDVVVVMVCEIADQRATPELGRVVKNYFDHVDFVIVARDQPSAVRSLLGQHIRMWNRKDVTRLDVEGFTQRHFRRGSYDYSRLWSKWTEKQTDYNVHFIPYRDGEGTDDLSGDVFTLCNLGPFPYSHKIIEGERIHSSFSAQKMRQLALVKRWTYRVKTIPGALPLGKRVFELLQRLAHREIIGRKSGFSRWTFSSAERDYIREIYRESNEDFRRKLGESANEARWQRWFASTLGTSA